LGQPVSTAVCVLCDTACTEHPGNSEGKEHGLKKKKKEKEPSWPCLLCWLHIVVTCIERSLFLWGFVVFFCFFVFVVPGIKPQTGEWVSPTELHFLL
jgi:hypothetical protein